MTQPRLFAISNVHGEFDALVQLLKRIQYRKGVDQIVFLGDYVNRSGTQPVQVVELIRKLVQNYGAIALRGDCEQMYINLLTGPPEKRRSALRMLDLYADKDRCTRDAYEKYHELLEEHVGFFQSLPLYHDDGMHLFVHAGIPPGWNVGGRGIKNSFYFLWDKEFHKRDTRNVNRLIVYGHTSVYSLRQSEPQWDGNKVCINVSSSGVLGALQLLPVKRWWAVPVFRRRRSSDKDL